jgi:hypothetical protein
MMRLEFAPPRGQNFTAQKRTNPSTAQKQTNPFTGFLRTSDGKFWHFIENTRVLELDRLDPALLCKDRRPIIEKYGEKRNKEIDDYLNQFKTGQNPPSAMNGIARQFTGQLLGVDGISEHFVKGLHVPQLTKLALYHHFRPEECQRRISNHFPSSGYSVVALLLGESQPSPETTKPEWLSDAVIAYIREYTVPKVAAQSDNRSTSQDRSRSTSPNKPGRGDTIRPGQQAIPLRTRSQSRGRKAAP